jgi:hypothetical protein
MEAPKHTWCDAADLVLFSRETQVSGDGQSVRFTDLVKITIGRRESVLRLSFKSNVHREQSYSRVCRWTPSGWVEVYSLLKRATPTGLSHTKEARDFLDHSATAIDQYFMEDRERLLERARVILGAE